MKGNFLAQFSGPAPEEILWGFEVYNAQGKRVISYVLGADLQCAFRLVTKLRELHPGTDIRVKAGTLLFSSQP